MNVLIVEDSEAVPRYLQSAMSDIPGIVVIGCVEDAIKRIDTLLPDIVIFDARTKNQTVIGLLENIKKRHPTIKLTMLVDCANEFYFNRGKHTSGDFFNKALQFLRYRAALWAYHFDNKFAATDATPLKGASNSAYRAAYIKSQNLSS